jgi:hypothetical protein
MHQFEIVSATQGRYEFRADTSSDLDLWVQAIQNSILGALEALPSRTSTVSSDALPGKEVSAKLPFLSYSSGCFCDLFRAGSLA